MASRAAATSTRWPCSSPSNAISPVKARLHYLLDSETDWRLEVSEPLLGPSGVYLAAPAHRVCSAQQGALMLREGPRLPAVGCETGDCSHVGVGGVLPGAQYNLRYPGDSDDTVRLLAEVLVPELIAARAWQAQRR